MASRGCKIVGNQAQGMAEVLPATVGSIKSDVELASSEKGLPVRPDWSPDEERKAKLK